MYKFQFSIYLNITLHLQSIHLDKGKIWIILKQFEELIERRELDRTEIHVNAVNKIVFETKVGQSFYQLSYLEHF